MSSLGSIEGIRWLPGIQSLSWQSEGGRGVLVASSVPVQIFTDYGRRKNMTVEGELHRNVRVWQAKDRRLIGKATSELKLTF